MYKYLITSFLSIILCSGLKSQSFKETTPLWVKEVAIPKPDKSLEGGGIQYLLSSNQVNFKKHTGYRKEVFSLQSTDAVANYSNITVLYDPSYQQLKFHSISIYRNGTKIDKLSTHTVNTYQREGNMERSIYDGSYTAVVNLSDVRQNDILEYSYSLTGEHPAFPDHLYSTQSFQFGVPVGAIHYRVLMPTNEAIPYKSKNNLSEPLESTMNGQLCYEWLLTDVSELQYFDQTPAWFRNDPYVEFSNYRDWGEVIKQIAPFYKVDLQDQFYFDKVVQEFDAAYPEDRIIRAIRFVQNEVRYLGFETGLNAYKPHLAKDVYHQRYGDCKDKSFLLVNLLEAMGYEAYPVLVNSYVRQGLKDFIPSPYNFDHVVVKLIYQNNAIYIDPTITNQGGDIFNLNFPSYSKGLVIKSGVIELESIPNKNRNSIYVIEDLEVTKDNASSVRFSVSTDYSGFAADNMRNYLANSSEEDVKRDYLNYYKDVFPNIQSARDLSIKDDLDKNVIHVDEIYTVDSLWVSSDEEFTLDYFPAQIRDIFNIDLEANRIVPLELTYPYEVENRTRIWVPEPWPVETSTFERAHAAFSYSNKVDYYEQTEKPYILLTHTYQTKKNEVKLIEQSSFEQLFNEIYSEQILFNLFYSPSKTGFSWSKVLLVLITLVILVFAIIVSIRVYRQYDPKPENWALKHERKIGGWLLLPLLGLIFSFFRFVYLIVTSGYLDDSWLAYLDSSSVIYSPSMAGLILFELICSVCLMVLTALCIVLFIKRRSSLPKVISILYGTACLYVLLDYGLYYLVEPQEYFDEWSSVIRAMVPAAIWIPIFMRSERVKETFVRMRGSQLEQQINLAAETEEGKE